MQAESLVPQVSLKAYDLKVLAERLKAQGVEVAEEALKLVVSETLDWTAESAVISKTPYDNVLVVIIPVVKPKIMEAIEKVNPKD